MSERLPWFRCFPSALLGALAGMPADEGFVYVVALMRIYETGGPVAETPRTLARRTGMTERRASAALSELIDAGKITRLSDGRIDAESTHDEIDFQQGMRQANSTAGKISAEVRAGKTQRNQRKRSTRVEQPLNHIRDKNIDYSETTSLRNPDEARKNEWPADYEERVWKLYPKGTDKQPSLKRLRALHASDDLPFEILVAGIERLICNISDSKFAPTLDRFIREEKWNDEYRTKATGDLFGSPGDRHASPHNRSTDQASFRRSGPTGVDAVAAALADRKARRAQSMGGGDLDQREEYPDDPNVIDADWRDASGA